MILKIDSTDSNKVSVEILEKSKSIDKIVEFNKRGSQILLPLIMKILEKNKQSLRSSSLDKLRTAGLRKNLEKLTAIKVNTGPGSFTGTRVGVAAANALGFALNIPVNGSHRQTGKKGTIALPKYSKSRFD